MLAALHRPLPLAHLIVAAIGLSAAVGLYCVGYSALSGRPEPIGAALLWAAVNILPWFLALELGKRGQGWWRSGAALAAAFAASMLLGAAAGGDLDGFETWRRVPALLLTGILLAALRVSARPLGRRAEAGAPWPLTPHRIDWVAAAGNYVEIHGEGGTLVHRASLTEAERRLMNHGFVRIHRSILVRRDRIARIRPADVILHDGTSLKTGKRYRVALGG